MYRNDNPRSAVPGALGTARPSRRPSGSYSNGILITTASTEPGISFPISIASSCRSPTARSSRPRPARARAICRLAICASTIIRFSKQSEERNKYKVRLWRTGPGSQLALYPNLNVNDAVWRGLVRDVRFRRALSLAVNRHEINQAIYFGLAIEGQNTVLPQSPLYEPQYRSGLGKLRSARGQPAARRDRAHQARQRRHSAACPTAGRWRSSSRIRAN